MSERWPPPPPEPAATPAPPPPWDPSRPPPPPPPPAPGMPGAPTVGYGHPPAYGPPPGYPPYGGYGPARQTESKAVVALVLAIASWVACPFIPAIAALIVAADADRRIAESGGRLDGAGQVRAARIVAWIHLGLVTAGVLIYVIVVIAVVTAGEATPAPASGLV